MKTVFSLIFLIGILAFGFANANPTNPDPPGAEFQIIKSDNVANVIEIQSQNFDVAVQYRASECSFSEPLQIEKDAILPANPGKSFDFEKPCWRKSIAKFSTTELKNLNYCSLGNSNADLC